MASKTSRTETVRFFNARPYHVVTSHHTFTYGTGRRERMFSQMVFVNHTQVASYRSHFITLRETTN